MRFGKFAGVTGAALIAVASIAGCGGNDGKAAAGSSASAATESSSTVSTRQYESASQISIALSMAGIPCAKSGTAEIVAMTITCTPTGSTVPVAIVTIYVNSSPTVFERRLSLETGMVTTSTSAQAIYLVQGADWFVSCNAMFKKSDAQTACTQIAGVVGGQPQFFKSASYAQ